MTGKKIVLLMALFCLGFTAQLLAQDGGGDAPQILTTDLASEMEAQSEQITVNFVIVDSDQVTKVTIDGEPQTFDPGDTVLITKEFRFTKGIRVITVVAEDEEGNIKEKTFRVAFGVPLSGEGEKKKEDDKLTYKVALELKYEVDDNPTNDLSLPMEVGSLGSVQGVVNDSEQPDNKTSLNVILSGSYGATSGYFGYLTSSYDKAENVNLGTNIMLLGALHKFAGAGKPGFQLGYTLMDINVGGNDYSLNQTLAPGFEFQSVDEDGSYKKVLGFDLIMKSFSEGDRDAVTQYTLKYTNNFKDKDKLDSSKGVTALGTSSEGTIESENTFFSYDADWINKWDSGYRLDAGFGFQYRTYPNDAEILTDEILGTTRVDVPLRFSMGTGWHFTKDISAMLNYKYLFNLSNDSPYVRTVYGLTVKGSF